MKALATYLLSLTALVGAAAHAGQSLGFTIAARSPDRPPLVVCGVRLPIDRPGLYCASPVITRGAYDGRGIVRLSSNGPATTVASGNDMLLAIEGDLDRSARPRLSMGSVWHVGGYACSLANSLTCRRGHHGFTIGTRLRSY